MYKKSTHTNIRTITRIQQTPLRTISKIQHNPSELNQKDTIILENYFQNPTKYWNLILKTNNILDDSGENHVDVKGGYVTYSLNETQN